MSRVTQQNKMIPLVVCGVLSLALIGGFWWYRSSRPAPVAEDMPIIPTTPTPSPATKKTLASPTPAPTTSTLTQPSPDGKVTLIIRSKLVANQTEYSVLVQEASKTGERQVFTETLDLSTTLLIPFNTWEPNNKHFFLEEHSSTSRRFLVFQASGAPFPSGPFLDVNAAFAQNEIPFRFDEATGWAAPNLLIVRTRTPDGTADGPTYWFGLTKQSFTRLSTSF